MGRKKLGESRFLAPASGMTTGIPEAGARRPATPTREGKTDRPLLRLDPLQGHLEKPPPRLAVRRHFPDLKPPAAVVAFDGVADVAELRNLHPPHQLPVGRLGL